MHPHTYGAHVDCLRLHIAALANTLLFVCVSVPFAGNRQARKEGFAEYKAATRMLLPIKKPLFKK